MRIPSMFHPRDLEMFRPGLGGTRRFYNDPPDWRTSLPEPLRADAALKDFKDVGALAQSYITTKALVGSSIRPPGPDASADDRKSFIEKLQKAAPELIYAPEKADEPVLASLWKRLGKPDSADAYALDEAAKAAGLDEKEMRAIAETAGLTKGQFDSLVKKAAEARTVESQKFKDAQEALAKEWGAAHGERVKAAAAAAKRLGMTDAAVQAILDGKAPAEQVKFMHSVATALGTNPKELERQKDGTPGKFTPAEANAAIAEIMTNREHAYWNGNHPGHRAAVQRMVELQSQANPEASLKMETAGFRS